MWWPGGGSDLESSPNVPDKPTATTIIASILAIYFF
ncbi:hypothetical protein ZEAMMB73_Zm00001d032766 [Zea mays]|uniref:Uncharacterized protein n=1 Tax=Zea mays TaxID=4577 RepID=A0A1D6KTV4_MAIZE|nr:hypothetical protein ZEAMMB73_Zm00001d032766 [Zea mays]